MTQKLSGIGKTALITGGSSGIGFELSKLFARDGYRVIIVARKREELNQAAKELKYYGDSIKTISKDLSLPESAEELFSELENENIDVLVNNAGFGVYGLFYETDLEREVQMMNLNMITLTKLTKHLLKGMMDRQSGKILNLASTAAFQPGPLMAVYFATKAYVLSFSEALANELEGTGVTVTALCPGPTETGFRESSNLEQSKLFQKKQMSPIIVAKAGYSGLMKGKTIVIPGLKNNLLAFSVRLVPRKMVVSTLRYMQEKKEG